MSIEIELTAEEHRRLQAVAAAWGKTVEQLAAEAINDRYALRATTGRVIPLRRTPRDKQGDKR